MASSAKKWPWIFVVLGLLIPLLQPVMPDVVSDYRLFLVSTMIIAAIAVLGLNLLGDGLRDVLDPRMAVNTR